MSSVRLLQLFELGLSCRSEPSRHWERIVQAINSQPPDLAVCTGNLTLADTACEEDLAFAAAQLKRLRCPVLTLPGWREIGRPEGAGHGGHRLTRRRDRYLKHLGPDWWLWDIDDWRLIGLNVLLFGSGLDAEIEQLAWLEATVMEAQEQRPLALFCHRYPFTSHPHEGTAARNDWRTELCAEAASILASANMQSIGAEGHGAVRPTCLEYRLEADGFSGQPLSRPTLAAPTIDLDRDDAPFDDGIARFARDGGKIAVET